MRICCKHVKMNSIKYYFEMYYYIREFEVLTNMRNIIIFYENFYKNILESSLSNDVCVLGWVSSDNISYATNFIKEHLSLFSRGDFTVCLMLSHFSQQNIIRQFLSILGINKKQILNIYQLYLQHLPIKRYQQIMANTFHPLDGLVFGISHGLTGILEDLLPGNVRNFCSSSQDIYFNTKILSLLIEEYYETVSNIKYVIFDMFDYNYFNFDTILSTECENYLLANGFNCEERIPWNKANNSNDINCMLTQLWSSRTNPNVLADFNDIFPGMHCPNSQEYYLGIHLKTTLPEQTIATYTSPDARCFSSIQRRVFEPTIQFQIANFQTLSGIIMSFKSQYPNHCCSASKILYC